MKNKILYITNSTDDGNQLGYRHSNILKNSSNFLDIDLLDFAFTKRKLTIFHKILNKLFIYPDIEVFNLWKYKKHIRNKLTHNHYNLALIGVVPFSFLSLASFIKKNKPDLKVIVDMTDPFSAHVSYIYEKYFHKYFIHWYEKKHFKNIDNLIVLNEEIKNYYHHKYSFLKNIIVLEQGTNLTSFKNNVIKINNKLEVIYAGIFYKKVREPYKLYDAINQYPGDIRLSVYGSFKKIFLPPINERFFYGGKLDRPVLMTKFSNADVIVFLDNFYGLQIPGKILDTLAMNKPILFIYENEQSPSLKYVSGYKGIFYTKNKTDEIIKQLDEIANCTKNDYNRDITKFNWENLVKESIFIRETPISMTKSEEIGKLNNPVKRRV